MISTRWKWALYLLGVLLLVIFILVCVRLRYNAQWGDVFSLGQLLVDLLLLPAAIIGFLMAAEEFRKTQSAPDVDLYWEVGGKTSRELVLPLPLNDALAIYLRPVLINSGQAVTVWYMLNFSLPQALISELGIYMKPHDKGFQVTATSVSPSSDVPPSSYLAWNPIIGEQSNWRYAQIVGEGSGVLITFMSNGTIAAYPNYELLLGTIYLYRRIGPGKPSVFQIPYTIVGDWGKRQDNSLTIRFE